MRELDDDEQDIILYALMTFQAQTVMDQARIAYKKDDKEFTKAKAQQQRIDRILGVVRRNKLYVEDGFVL